MAGRGETKAELRAAVREARARRSETERVRAAELLRDVVLSLPETATAGVVAAYVAIGTEPPTLPLLDALHQRGVRVLLPVLEPDGDLDWGWYAGPGSLLEAARGLREPAGPTAGRDAIGRAGVVFVPALAVDEDGARLGRGGGAYDRALARATGWTAALLYDDELVSHLPTEPHDVPVAAVVTPAGVRRLR